MARAGGLNQRPPGHDYQFYPQNLSWQHSEICPEMKVISVTSTIKATATAMLSFGGHFWGPHGFCTHARTDRSHIEQSDPRGDIGLALLLRHIGADKGTRSSGLLVQTEATQELRRPFGDSNGAYSGSGSGPVVQILGVDHRTSWTGEEVG